MAATTIDIIKRLQNYKQFKGVYSIDKLPFYILEKPFGIVVNLDPSWKPGSHWVAIYCPKYGQVIYFDSFGLQPPNQIKVFIERNVKYHNILCINSTFQGDLSIKYGYFCMLFLETYFNNQTFPLIKCQTTFNEIFINKLY